MTVSMNNGETVPVSVKLKKRLKKMMEKQKVVWDNVYSVISVVIFLKIYDYSLKKIVYSRIEKNGGS